MYIYCTVHNTLYYYIFILVHYFIILLKHDKLIMTLCVLLFRIETYYDIIFKFSLRNMFQIILFSLLY